MKNKSKVVQSERMNHIEPFHVMRVLQQAKRLEQSGRDIIHLEVGEPDFPTPFPIVEAGKAALSEGLTKYTPAAGLPELREKISDFYATRYAVTVSAERIIITPGASGALQLVLAALVNPGDEVLIPDPGYPCNKNFVELFNAKPILLDVFAENNYQPDIQQIRSACSHKTRALMLASPANPTGAVLSHEALVNYYSLTKEMNAALIVDEIYHGLVYNPSDVSVKAATALSLPDNDHVFVINSFSKYFGMTGWRLGWVVVPDNFVEVIDRLAQNLFLCAPTPAQYAALAAFDETTIEILEQRRYEFMRRRDFLFPALNRLGFDIPIKPGGAFYLYGGCEKFSDDSLSFSSRILDVAGVAITPGLDFGLNQPHRHLRFAYTNSVEKLESAIERLQLFLKYL